MHSSGKQHRHTMCLLQGCAPLMYAFDRCTDPPQRTNAILDHVLYIPPLFFARHNTTHQVLLWMHSITIHKRSNSDNVPTHVQHFSPAVSVRMKPGMRVCVDAPSVFFSLPCQNRHPPAEPSSTSAASACLIGCKKWWFQV